MKKIYFTLFLTLLFLASKAQFGQGWDRGFNFGGGGGVIKDLRYDASGNLYFVSTLMGRGLFAGSALADPGGAVSFPHTDLIYGKIAADGTQTLLKQFSAAAGQTPAGDVRLDTDGNLYMLITGNATAIDFGNGITAPAFGVKLLKVANSGQSQWVKSIDIGVNLNYGASGITLPNVLGFQITNGGLYTVITSNNKYTDTSNPAYNEYPTRVIKLDYSGNAIWNYEMTSSSTGLSGVLITPPKQFVDNNGNVVIGVTSQSAGLKFNGATVATDGNYGGYYSWIFALDNTGARKWITGPKYPATMRAVDPVTGEIYLTYSAFGPTTAAPFSALPNLSVQPGSSFVYGGLVKLTGSGALAGEYHSGNASLLLSYNMFISSGNNLVFYGSMGSNTTMAIGDYVVTSPSGTQQGVVAQVDKNFENGFLVKAKAEKIDELDGKITVGASFSTSITLGTTTLNASYNDPAFTSRFPLFGSTKNDVYIGQLNANTISVPQTTWQGTDNNWNNAANWSNGIPTAESKVIFSANNAFQPTTATTPLAGNVVVNAGVNATLPLTLKITSKLQNSGQVSIPNTTSFYNFNGYGATAISGKGELFFNGTGSNPSIFYTFNNENQNSVAFNQPVSLSGTVYGIRFAGATAKLSGTVKVINPDVNAISGYTNTNFVDGTITRAINSSGIYAFPIGSGSSYLPATITTNNLTGTSFLTASYSTSSAGTVSTNLGSTTANAILGTGYWMITPDTAPSAGTYNLSLEKRVYNNGVTDASRYVILKRNIGNPWSFEGTSGTSTQTGGNVSGAVVSNGIAAASSTNLNGFSDFIIAIAQSGLASGLSVTTSTWAGSASKEWNNSANWSNGIPNATVNAVIPLGLSNYPETYTANDNAKSLTVNSGASIKLNSILKLTNGLINNGTVEIINALNSSTEFTGYGGGITGTGKLVFKFGFTRITAGIINCDVEINVGNTTTINVLGKFGGNVNIVSGLVTARDSNGQWFEQTTASSSMQITASTNHIAGRIYKTVNTTGTYVFPIGDDQWDQTLTRKYAPVTISNNNISAPAVYNVWFNSINTSDAVNMLDGTDAITQKLNSGAWYIFPSSYSSTGTVDISFQATGYTNGRPSVSDYILLRKKNNVAGWVKVDGAVFSESNGILSVSAAGIAPFTYETIFCIGIKASTTTWTGTTSSSWTTASNWTNGVPTNSVKAIFNSVSRYPSSIPSSNAAAVLEVQPGAILVIPQTFSPALAIVNNGTIEVSGTGIFYGFGSGTTFSQPTGSGKLVFNNNSPSTIDSYYSGAFNNAVEINRSGVVGLIRTTNFAGSVNLVNGIITPGSGQTFNMTNPNATITSTATGFINGTLNRAINSSGSYNFPVGSSSNAATATLVLNNITGPQTISASFSNTINGSAPDITVGAVQVNELLNAGIWTISPNTTLTGGTYNVTLQGSGYTNPSSNPANYTVLKRDYSFSSWGSYGTPGMGSETGNVVTVTSSGLSGFSEFAIGKASGTLPVKLVAFEAKLSSGFAILNWQTASELGNDKFVVERSTDGVQFLAIGEVKGQGSSRTVQDYRFEDKYPAAGFNYYRLKQVDYAGNSSITEVRALNVAVKRPGVSVYPNPVSDMLYISGLDLSKLNAKLYSLSGQVVLECELLNPEVKIPSSVPAGQYILKLTEMNGKHLYYKIFVSR